MVDPASAKKDLQACKKDETALNWNQTGPSDLWHAANGLTNLAEASGNLPPVAATPVTSVSLPAGSFFVEAKTILIDTNEVSDFYCTLSDAAGQLDFSTEEAADDESATVALQTAVTFASPDTIHLNFSSTGTHSVAEESKLDAIKVGAIH